MSQNDTVILVMAAGSGSRFGADIPKQYCLLEGLPVLMHTLTALKRALPHGTPRLVLSADMEEYWRGLCDSHGFDSPKVIHGGATRAQSVANGINALVAEGYGPGTTVLVHDGARPLVTPSMARAVATRPFSVPVIKVTDSLRVITDDGSQSVDRALYRCVQTPQSAPLGALKSAIDSLAAGLSAYTDEATLLQACGHKINLVEGDPANIKITNPMDLAIAGALLKARGQ